MYGSLNGSRFLLTVAVRNGNRRRGCSASSALVVGRETGAAWRATRTGPQHSYVKIQFRNGAAERVTVHAQLPGRLTLIALVFLQHGHNESLLKFADGFRVENSALVHLQNQGFQLVFHSASLYEFHPEQPLRGASVAIASVRDMFRYRAQQVPSLHEALAQFSRRSPNQGAPSDQHERRNPRITNPGAHWAERGQRHHHDSANRDALQEPEHPTQKLVDPTQANAFHRTATYLSSHTSQQHDDEEYG